MLKLQQEEEGKEQKDYEKLFQVDKMRANVEKNNYLDDDFLF